MILKVVSHPRSLMCNYVGFVFLSFIFLSRKLDGETNKQTKHHNKTRYDTLLLYHLLFLRHFQMKYCPDRFRKIIFSFFLQIETILNMAYFCSTLKHECFPERGERYCSRGFKVQRKCWRGCNIYHCWINTKLNFTFNRPVAIKLIPHFVGSCWKSSLHPIEAWGAENPPALVAESTFLPLSYNHCLELLH